MSAFGFHQPAAAALAALAVPIVTLYFLKLKRPRTMVPSLALWRAVLEDKRVNAPFQRFRKHLPLWLQLAILALVTLGAMLPFWSAGSGPAGRHPVLIDTSASMAARTAPGGPTRMELAKKEARQLVSRMAPGEEISLISFSDQARQLTAFTDDRRELDDAIDRLVPEPVPSRLDQALELVQGLWRGGSFASAEIISDGNLPEAVDADLSFHIDYHPLKAPAANAGITALDARRRADGRWDVFCAVDAAEQVPEGVRLRLSTQDSQVLCDRPLALTPLATARVVLTIDGDQSQIISAELVASGFDALASDDRATLALPALRPVTAWIAPGAAAWRRAVEALDGVRVLAEPPTPADPAAPAVDLCIGDQPAHPSATLTLLDGVVPAPISALIESDPAGGASAVVDWRRSDPLLSHVSLEDLVIAQGVSWAARAGERDLEQAGWRVLVHGDRGPLMVAHAFAGRTEAALLFASARSTLPYRVALPVIAANLVEAARDATGQVEAHALATGVLAAELAQRLVHALPGQAVTLSGPASSQSVTADADGMPSGLRLGAPGLYHLRAGAAIADLGAGLLSRQETRLVTAETIRFHELTLASAEHQARGELSLWSWLAVLALLVCLFEWWYAHHRPWQSA